MPLSLGFQNYLDQGSGGSVVPLALGYQGTRLYVFDEYGRISTSTGAGAALSFPDGYTRGEAVELRYTTADASNGQFQGIFMDVRTSVANSSTIRGMEVTAQSEGNINVGGLTGAAFKAIPRGTSGTITASIGVQGECSVNSSSWAGTITAQVGGYFKVSNDNGGTYTALDFAGDFKGNVGVLVHNEYIDGTVKMDAAFAVMATNITTDSFNAIIDSTAARTTVSDTDKVLLWKFLREDGTPVFMRYDTSDNALAFATS